MQTCLLFFIASVVGGAINAIAGGGGLITFPLLMLVGGPLTADATSAVAGFASYPTALWRTRSLLRGVIGAGWLWLLLIPSVAGGLIGALLLVHTGNRNFVEFVPWLVLVATMIVAMRPLLVDAKEEEELTPAFGPMLWSVAIASIFVVALYGGYFGAGIGILMIGALTFILPGEIRRVVAVKNFLNGFMRGVAVLVLVLKGNVDWHYGAPMAMGGLIGGYVGGILSHRANRTAVRWTVVGIGLAVSGHYFWKLYAQSLMHIGGE